MYSVYSLSLQVLLKCMYTFIFLQPTGTKSLFYLYSITVWSATTQTTLWGGPPVKIFWWAFVFYSVGGQGRPCWLAGECGVAGGGHHHHARSDEQQQQQRH